MKNEKIEQYANKVEVMTMSGEVIPLWEWQKIYELPPNKIGKHYSLMEWRFKQDIEDYGKLVVCVPLIILLDAFRDLRKAPVRVASFNRDEKKQEDLRRRGFKAATHSPHVVKMAADVDCDTVADVHRDAKLMKEAATAAGIKCRIGWRTYLPDQTFIHVDVCPMYYEAGGAFHHVKHPLVWEKQISW